MKNLLFAIRAASALTCGVLITGCASNGYITSTVSTGLGLDVSENPQTQVPHVRFGYIRNGLYYIPTSKLGDATGDVTKTPNVVSKIHVATKFLQSITISEKFAVGKKAVLSGSAQQVFQDLSSERGPHSPIPSSDAPDLSAPPVPLPPRQTPKPRAGNKPAAPAADRDALVGEVISAIKKVPAAKNKASTFGLIMDNAGAPAKFSRDKSGLALFVNDPATPTTQLQAVRDQLKGL